MEPRSKLKRGDVLTAERLNAIEDELRRLSGIRGGAGIAVRRTRGGMHITADGTSPLFHIRLTVNGASGNHEWEGMYWTGSAYATTGVTGNDKDYACEINGLTCPKSDAILLAWRDLSGRVTFRAVRYRGKADADINAGATGTVSVWAAQSGSVVDTSLNVTALNWNDLTKVTSGKRVLLTPCEAEWVIDYEAC